MGILSTSQSNQKWPFNWQNIFFVFVFSLLCVGTVAFALFQATTIIEHGINFYMYISTIVSTIYYLLQLWQATQIINFIGRAEEFIANSK